MEVQCQPLELDEELLVISEPIIRIGPATGQERSNWQHVATGGRLCRKPQWRWLGRLEASVVRPCGKRAWRQPR